MSNVYLSIGAHIGDAELTSGCFLASKALEGNKIITLALTAGERGNPPHLTTEEYRKQKVNEAKSFAKILGGEAIVFDYEDGLLPDNEEVRFKVAEIIRKYRPKQIFTHWKNSMHKDHELTFKIVNDASFYANLEMGNKVKGERHFAPVFYAENWEDEEDFKPYIYLECSKEGFDLWSRALKEHWFVMNSSSFKYYDYYTHLASVRGALSRTKYAEAFAVLEYQKKKIINEL